MLHKPIENFHRKAARMNMRRIKEFGSLLFIPTTYVSTPPLGIDFRVPRTWDLFGQAAKRVFQQLI